MKMRTGRAAGATDGTNWPTCSDHVIGRDRDRGQMSVNLLSRTTDGDLYVIAIANRDSQCVDHRAGDFDEPVVCRINGSSQRRGEIDPRVKVWIAEPWWLERRRRWPETLRHHGPHNWT